MRIKQWLTFFSIKCFMWPSSLRVVGVLGFQVRGLFLWFFLGWGLLGSLGLSFAYSS
jgi:hypothetical protein